MLGKHSNYAISIGTRRRTRYAIQGKPERGNRVMFSKKKDDYTDYDSSEPVISSSPDVRRRKTSVIGPTLKFKGELSANEDLIIEGEIEGTIAHQDKNLTVGKEGDRKSV